MIAASIFIFYAPFIADISLHTKYTILCIFQDGASRHLKFSKDAILDLMCLLPVPITMPNLAQIKI